MSAVATPRRHRREQPGRSQPRHLEVVTPRRPVPTLVYALLTVLVLAAAVFGTVTLNALAAADAVESRALERQVAEGERVHAQLVADVASLEDPARIRATAEDLGLVPAVGGRHLVLERVLPADGATTEALPGAEADPLKPVLSAQR
ncbi:hypothetical protein FTX61_12225 [Nitriliruptoraceae bacterium ZYF776]|nr:hypothetical protein [Profundirhabdus halotolerans]